MKVKKILFIMIIALLAIMLLQVKVKAERIDMPTTGGTDGNVSEYLDSQADYFLTASNKLLTKAELSDVENAEEEIVAQITGECKGTIRIVDNLIVELNNFEADVIFFEKDYNVLNVYGVNSVRDINPPFGENESDTIWLYIDGDGTLTFDGDSGIIVANGMGIWGESSKAGRVIVYTGSYISQIKDNDGFKGIYVFGFEPDWSQIVEYLSYEIDYLFIGYDPSWTIPREVFTELAKHPNTEMELTCAYDGAAAYRFKGCNIKNPNINFNMGIEITYNPKWDMIDTKTDDVVYINFAHSGAVPGPIIIQIDNDNLKNGDILKCYYYNETTKMYEQVADAKMISDYELQLNIDHCSKYLVTKTELPENAVIKGNEDDKGNDGTEQAGDEKESEQKTNEQQKNEIKEDSTKAPGVIPHAGGTIVIMIVGLAILAIVITYKKNKELKGI